MKSVKWLYAMFFALTFTLVAELVGAFAVGSGAEWYSSLILPSFAVSGVTHSVIWCVVYALEAFIISQLLVGGNYSPYILKYVAIKLFSAVWTVCFFGLRQTFFSLAVLSLILILNFSYLKNLFKLKAHPLKAFLFLPVLLWYCYLWILGYCIVLIN